VSTEYVVWDDYRVEGYFEPGSYRWEEEIELWDRESWYRYGDTIKTDTPPNNVTWGFTLEVQSPDSDA